MIRHRAEASPGAFSSGMSPIIAMSIFPYLKDNALAGGCDDFLKKPIKMIDLMAHIRRFITPSTATDRS